jgi:hypothetical protein
VESRTRGNNGRVSSSSGVTRWWGGVAWNYVGMWGLDSAHRTVRDTAANLGTGGPVLSLPPFLSAAVATLLC